MTFIILLIIGGLIRACWHISKFRPQRSWIPIWDYPFGIKRPPLDAFHVYGGLFTLWTVYVFLLQPDWLINLIARLMSDNGEISIWSFLIHLAFYWFAFFWVFTLFYHVILMKPGYREWKYLLPIVGK